MTVGSISNGYLPKLPTWFLPIKWFVGSGLRNPQKFAMSMAFGSGYYSTLPLSLVHTHTQLNSDPDI